MSEKKLLISWRDDPKIVSFLDKLAHDSGVDRSDVLRMMVRTQIRMAADSGGL